MNSLSRYDWSKVSSPHMTVLAIVHIKYHSTVSMQATKQRNTSQGRYYRSVRHAESRGAEVMHVYDDIAIFVVDPTQGQEAVLSFCESYREDGCDTFDDAKVKFRLRYQLGEFGEDEAGLRARNCEGNSVKQSHIIQYQGIPLGSLHSADVPPEYLYHHLHVFHCFKRLVQSHIDGRSRCVSNRAEAGA